MKPQHLLTTAALISALLSLIFIACNDEDPITPQNFYFDLTRLTPSTDTILVGNNATFAGFVTNSLGDTIEQGRVYFTVNPDTIGNISPLPYGWIDLTEPDGFLEEVIFTGRKPGRAIIRGTYRTEDGVDRSADAVSIVVKESVR